MKSTASTVAAYLETLPPERREAIERVRRVILENLDRGGPEGGFEERMQYGVIGYCVPHSVWPHGHHTRPELPLMYMGLSSQKNDMVVYMLCLLHNERERAWFDAAWKATGKKLHLEVSGAGCCLRFKKVEELSLEVIGEAMRRMPMKTYLEDHVAVLARLGKGPDGKPQKKDAGVRSGAKGAKAAGAKKAGSPTAVKKAGKKAVTRAGMKSAKKAARKSGVQKKVGRG